jgi:two-component system response regulator HydG
MMKRILIVDDSADNLSLVKYFLQDEYECLLATSGVEAKDLISNISFDLIISDYQMENGDGLFLLEFLKSFPKAPPCIILTADLTKDADFFLRAGATGFCSKLRIMDSLLKEVTRVLD